MNVFYVMLLIRRYWHIHVQIQVPSEILGKKLLPLWCLTCDLISWDALPMSYGDPSDLSR